MFLSEGGVDVEGVGRLLDLVVVPPDRFVNAEQEGVTLGLSGEGVLEGAFGCTRAPTDAQGDVARRNCAAGGLRGLVDFIRVVIPLPTCEGSRRSMSCTT